MALLSHEHICAFPAPASQQSAVAVPGSPAMSQSAVLIESEMAFLEDCQQLIAAVGLLWGLLLPFAMQKLSVPKTPRTPH